MKHYKHPQTGEVFAFDSDEDRQRWGATELVPMTQAEVAAYVNPPRTETQILDSFTASIQQRLDDFARTRNYDSILSACTYATSSVAKFKAEGQACVNQRDATWAAAYAVLDKVQKGQRAMPTSLADIEADLPVLAWPN